MGERRTKQDVDNEESHSLARKHYFRAEKTTASNDDFKVLIMGMVMAVMILVGSVFIPLAQDNRVYRDVVGITPFHGVRVYGSYLGDEDRSITIYGELIKRRCTFKSLIAYIVDENGLRELAVLDTSPEGRTSNNRPPSTEAEAWGPWKVSIDIQDDETNPVGWEIYAEHTECSTKPFEQTNLFAHGAWVTHSGNTN